MIASHRYPLVEKIEALQACCAERAGSRNGARSRQYEGENAPDNCALQETIIGPFHVCNDVPAIARRIQDLARCLSVDSERGPLIPRLVNHFGFWEWLIARVQIAIVWI